MPDTLLIVVHPGSACGSANFNLGKLYASASRDILVDEIKNHNGGLLIVDGELSDELEFYPVFDQAISNGLAKAKEEGFRSERVFACDNSSNGWISSVLEHLSELPRTTRIKLTGAWFHEDGGGCVGALHDGLLREGWENVSVEGSVLMLVLDDEELHAL